MLANPYLDAATAIAFVKASSFVFDLVRFGNWGKREANLVLDVAAKAGAMMHSS